MRHVTETKRIGRMLIAAIIAGTATPVLAGGPSYGYCTTMPESVFGAELKRRYPQRILYYSGVIKVLEGQNANEPWGEFRRFIEAKGTSRSFTMNCSKHYSTVQAAQEALDSSNYTNITVERTGWTNVTASDIRAAPPTLRPPAGRREPGKVYVTLPGTVPTPAQSPGQAALPTASEIEADRAKAKASYDRQRARDEAEYRRVADENARRQAAYRAQIARQQAEYRAMLAAREAEAARVRADWEARVARCKAGEKTFCASQAVER